MSSLADAIAAWRRPAGQRPYVLGHRGARHAAPENTLAAFELSREEGADGVELDVRLDGDGNVIVLHDPTLERVTQGADSRHAEDIPKSELSRLDVGKGEHVPLLADVLAWAKQHDQRVNVELKSDVKNRRLLLERVAAVMRAQPLPLLLFSSFHPQFVWWLARHLPELPRAWLVHKKQGILRHAPGAHSLGANGVHPEHVLANAERVQHLKRTGCLVNVWTVNDTARARELAKNGVDAIISDTPGEILHGLL
ncbi:MAG TPA: glycerophosphodiester phosphodiesterase family protein [Polyangiaceae bacterium]|jgi:glycerophosphoryl diester phosphodiesterase|nr:glycerophosphodiester phosphodiesterase family protein [Polyangiaceae bacterium]